MAETDARETQPPVELPLAAIHDRFIAYVLDFLPFAAGFILTLLVKTQRIGFAVIPFDFVGRAALAWIGLYFLYQVAGNWTGATVGKSLLGLRVVTVDGTKLSFGRAFARAVMYLVGTPFFNYGFVIALFHPSSRALHDLAAGTVVVSLRRRSPAATLLMFLAAMALLIGLVSAAMRSSTRLATRRDVVILAQARDSLLVLARIEELEKRTTGAYTGSLEELARASGDVSEFRHALSIIFMPELFQIEAGSLGYRISATARDSHHTRLTVAGPPPKVLALY